MRAPVYHDTRVSGVYCRCGDRFLIHEFDKWERHECPFTRYANYHGEEMPVEMEADLHEAGTLMQYDPEVRS